MAYEGSITDGTAIPYRRYVEEKKMQDNSPSSLARAYADPSSRFEEYVDGESYYNAFYSQVVDAYNTYLVIGQMN